MPYNLKPIEINCDTPPDQVVYACQRLDFHKPLDVRWARLSRFQTARSVSDWLGKLFRRTPDPNRCSCGELLPVLDNYAFTAAQKFVADYRLGQCRRCRTIFWEPG
jgi:hypothetical protein